MKKNNPTGSFSGTRASEIVGITYRQLDYWTRTGLIVPSLETANVVAVNA